MIRTMVFVFQMSNLPLNSLDSNRIIMTDRSSSRQIKNNLSEQLKIFYNYSKDVPTKVIKPCPLPP